MSAYPGKQYKFIHNNLMQDENVLLIERQLNKRGFLSSEFIDGVYDLYTEKAVKSFQVTFGITMNGIVGATTWDYIFGSNAVNSDRLASSETFMQKGIESLSISLQNDAMPQHEYSGTPKNTPYFNSGNSKKFRKTDLELRIDFGANNALNKKIKHVYLRSVGTVVDASGNPLYEEYEFIAQDIEESDNKFKL